MRCIPVTLAPTSLPLLSFPLLPTNLLNYVYLIVLWPLELTRTVCAVIAYKYQTSEWILNWKIVVPFLQSLSIVNSSGVNDMAVVDWLLTVLVSCDPNTGNWRCCEHMSLQNGISHPFTWSFDSYTLQTFSLVIFPKP